MANTQAHTKLNSIQLKVVKKDVADIFYDYDLPRGKKFLTVPATSKTIDVWTGILPPESLVKTWITHCDNHQKLKPMCLYGETGTGKTLFFEYVSARMGIPLKRVNMREDMLSAELEGSKELVNGQTISKLSEIVKVYEQGGIALIDEIDKAPAGVQHFLHAFLDRRELSLTSLNLSVKASPMAVIVATANTNGTGENQRYHSSQTYDRSLARRMKMLETFYPQPEQEMSIVKKACPDIPNGIALRVVKTASLLREALVEPDFNAPFGPGDSIAWTLEMAFDLSQSPIDALKGIYLNSLKSVEREIAIKLVKEVWKETTTKPVCNIN